jgi:hypothetical protein
LFDGGEGVVEDFVNLLIALKNRGIYKCRSPFPGVRDFSIIDKSHACQGCR